MNGAMAGIAVLIAVLGALAFTVRNHVSNPVRKALWERAAAGLFGVAAFAGMIAFAPVLAALWQVTGTGAGLVVLAVLLAATGFFGFLMIGRGKGHHHHGSVAVAVIFGVTVALAAGGWHQIKHSAGTAITSAGQATGGVVTGSALTAGHHQALAAASTSHGRLAVIIALAALAIALIVFLRGYRKASQAAAPRRARGGQTAPGAIPAAGTTRAVPGGPLPAAGAHR